MRIFRTICFFILPSVLLRIFFPSKMSRGSKIGFSWICAEDIRLGQDVIIGHFNFIKTKTFYVSGGGKIKHFNIIRGLFDFNIMDKAWIHSFNKISSRVGTAEQYHTPKFVLGKGAAIMVHHIFDVTDDIIIGDNTLIAGSGSQFYTHSFCMTKEGCYRVDGTISLGKSNYIGTNSIVCAGIKTVDFVTIGANTTVTKDLDQSGLWVSSQLRHIIIIDNNPHEKFIESGIENIFRKIK